MKNYLTTQDGSMNNRGLSSSQSMPIINGNKSGYPINPFTAPYFMQVQYPVAQLDMDWYIRQCK
jgi:hypothetical protein